jgi:predicted acetyltransferase
MEYRYATPDDVTTLALLNQQLVEDEGHRNRSRPRRWFQERMRSFLNGGYEAVLFKDAGRVVTYALYTGAGEQPDTVYLRQFFVCRDCRRRGFGREAMRILKDEIWPQDTRLTVGVLWQNAAGRAFWKAMGYREYSLELEIMPADRGGQPQAHSATPYQG